MSHGWHLVMQVAALAEFRADWAVAVKTYQAAYLELLRIPPVGQLPLQRWTELTSVAEIMHLKVHHLAYTANVREDDSMNRRFAIAAAACSALLSAVCKVCSAHATQCAADSEGECLLQVVTLLLHQANVPEALAQFAQHMGAFRRMPLPPPPAAASAHGAWLVRQYTVMGDLLSSRVEAGLLPQQVIHRLLVI